MDKWLEAQPDEIVCWKVAGIDKERKCLLPPIMVVFGRYKKVNRLQGALFVNANDHASGKGVYQACYHLFYKRKAAIMWAHGMPVFKCTVKKEHIRHIGAQRISPLSIKNSMGLVLVADEFTFQEGDEYFTPELEKELLEEVSL